MLSIKEFVTVEIKKEGKHFPLGVSAQACFPGILVQNSGETILLTIRQDTL